MSGADEVGRDGGLVDEHLDCFGSFVRGDSGGEAVLWVAVDRDGQRGAPRRGVDGGLAMKIEPITVGFWQRDKHVAGGLFEHEHDGLGGDELGREDEVALVLA